MPKTFYKVVSFKRKNKKVIRTSWLNSQKVNLPDFLIVKYIPGKPAKPKIEGARLMVFEDLNSALNCAGDHNQIWECTVTNPEQLHHIKEYDSLSYTTEAGLKRVWDAINKYDHTASCFTLENMSGERFGLSPSSAYACDTVTLTKQVR